MTSAPASAQVWLRDRASTQGPGIRSGDFELHPGIAAELGYDSNYFNRAPNNNTGRINGAPGYPIVDTVRLRITPSFYLTTLTSQRRPDGTMAPPPSVTFSAGGAFIYSQFLMNAGEDTGATPATRNKLGRDFEWGILGDLALNVSPGRPWGLNIFDNFQRTAQPGLDPVVEAGLNRVENRAAAEIVHTRPGGLLDWRLGYALGITYFEAPPSTTETLSANDFNATRHEIYTTGRWRFLPRTALVYNGSFGINNYNKESPGVANSRPIRSRIGLSGLITDRFAVLALVGWGASFYNNTIGSGNRDFDSIIGQLEFRYFLNGSAPAAGSTAPPASSSFAVGFTRDFQNSYIGNYYVRNRGYLGLSTLLGQRFLLNLDGGAAVLQYADYLDRVTGATMVTAFSTLRADATLFLEYRLKDWLGLNATYQYLAEFTDQRLPANNQRIVTFSMGFQRHQAFLGLRAFF
jgi:hypothetical protein